MKKEFFEKNKLYLRKLLFVLLIVTVLVAIDIATKVFFENLLLNKPNGNLVLIPNVLSLQFEKNTGAAFSMFSNSTVLLSIFSMVFLFVFLMYDYNLKVKNKTYYVSFILVFAGGLGNLLDRLFLGYVRDFIRFDFLKWLGIFNFADAFLTIGMILFCVFILFHHDKLLKTKSANI